MRIILYQFKFVVQEREREREREQKNVQNAVSECKSQLGFIVDQSLILKWMFRKPFQPQTTTTLNNSTKTEQKEQRKLVLIKGLMP